MGQPVLRAWDVTCCGITATIFARSRGRAQSIAADAAHDAGYARTQGEAYKTVRSKRAPWYDVDALKQGIEGFKV